MKTVARDFRWFSFRLGSGGSWGKIAGCTDFNEFSGAVGLGEILGNSLDSLQGQLDSDDQLSKIPLIKLLILKMLLPTS